MVELKHCPFCGKTDAVVVTTLDMTGEGFVHPDYFTVVCNVHEGGCGAECGGQYPTEEEAAAAWNRRADHDSN